MEIERGTQCIIHLKSTLDNQIYTNFIYNKIHGMETP